MTKSNIIGNFKRCNKCKQWKVFGDFGFARPNVMRSICKTCSNVSLKNWLDKNSEKRKKYAERDKRNNPDRHLNFRSTQIGAVKTLYYAAMQRSRKNKQECNLTWEYLYVLAAQQEFKCAQTGVIFDLIKDGQGREFRKLTAMSIDRIDNSKGYVIGNVQIVCWFYNAAKGTSSDDDIWQLLKETFKNRLS